MSNTVSKAVKFLDEIHTMYENNKNYKEILNLFRNARDDEQVQEIIRQNGIIVVKRTTQHSALNSDILHNYVLKYKDESNKLSGIILYTFIVSDYGSQSKTGTRYSIQNTDSKREGISESNGDFELYISCHTGLPQVGNFSREKARVFSVIYQGQAMTASQKDYTHAVNMANNISKRTGKEIGYWDGDLGKFVASLDDLIKK